MTEQPSNVVAALSGGLDSSMAAALLKMAGWEVHALHFLLPAPSSTAEERIKAAQMIAGDLQIPIKIVDLRETFSQCVIEPFIHAYVEGLTPNPCVTCNQLIKFRHLIDYAKQNSIHHIATGHYARVKTSDGNPRVELWRGRDTGKDQSYFLHRLDQPCLSRVVFPLGQMTKNDVRHRALDMGLPVHSTPESQEVCFISEGDYRVFLSSRTGPKVNKRGNIINVHGEILGEHSGTYRYTIGQRHGLGIASPRPYYVKETRPDTHEVIVGRKEELYSRSVGAELFNWIGSVPCQKAMKAHAQIRYRHKAMPGRLEVLSNDRVRFIFDDPQWAVTPGQALVCYDGDQVIGGGWIKKNTLGQL